jgi:hypothetical protein
MAIDNWAFFYAADGNEITRGWQGYEDQARAFAQELANERQDAVEFQSESTVGTGDDEDDAVVSGEVVEPEETEDAQIARAVEYLDAVKLADGRYAYYADETRRHYVVDASDIASLGDDLWLELNDAYSMWCAATESEEMPEGWTPKA